jgi:hypothetical protein
MEEPEVPMEQVHEHIEHHAEMSQEKWVSCVALSTAVLAALAAVTALLAGDHANEAMVHQIQASDQWAYYQAKGIKSAILETRRELLKAAAQPVDPILEAKLNEYAAEQKVIEEDATHKQTAAEAHLHHHVILARGVTMFQIAIAVAAISILTKRRLFWGISLIFGALGLVFLFSGI